MENKQTQLGLLMQACNPSIQERQEDQFKASLGYAMSLGPA